uniref:Uncharacterized protein n=1 Tax=Arundo donax TaxID=35708 RepID=A0A0A9HFW8_ARUDO
MKSQSGFSMRRGHMLNLLLK